MIDSSHKTDARIQQHDAVIGATWGTRGVEVVVDQLHVDPWISGWVGEPRAWNLVRTTPRERRLRAAGQCRTRADYAGFACTRLVACIR